MFPQSQYSMGPCAVVACRKSSKWINIPVHVIEQNIVGEKYSEGEYIFWGSRHTKYWEKYSVKYWEIYFLWQQTDKILRSVAADTQRQTKNKETGLFSQVPLWPSCELGSLTSLPPTWNTITLSINENFWHYGWLRGPQNCHLSLKEEEKKS